MYKDWSYISDENRISAENVTKQCFKKQQKVSVSNRRKQHKLILKIWAQHVLHLFTESDIQLTLLFFLLLFLFFTFFAL